MHAFVFCFSKVEVERKVSLIQVLYCLSAQGTDQPQRGGDPDCALWLPR